MEVWGGGEVEMFISGSSLYIYLLVIYSNQMRAGNVILKLFFERIKCYLC